MARPRAASLTRRLFAFWAVSWMALAAPCVVAGTPSHDFGPQSTAKAHRATGQHGPDQADSLVCLHECNQVAVQTDHAPAPAGKLQLADRAPGASGPGQASERTLTSTRYKAPPPRGPALFIRFQSFLI